jgi:propanediol dehydratase small subunit
MGRTMTHNRYMADVLHAFNQAGVELTCLERMRKVAADAGQEHLAVMIDRLAAQCEDRIAELHNELRTAGWDYE